MRRVLILILLLSVSAFASVSVSGNLKDIGTGAVNSATSFVRFQLVNCGSNQPYTTAGVLARTTVDLHPNSSGVISGSLYANNEIVCGGGTTTQYDMTVYYNGTPGLTKRIVANASFDIKAPVYAVAQTLQPSLPAPNYVQTNPSTSQTVVQPEGSTLTLGGATVTQAHNGVRNAAQFGSIDAAVNDCGSNPCIVVIPSSYSGPESGLLTTTTLGYTVYAGANNVTIVDQRHNASTPGNPFASPLYPVLYGGRTAGQLNRLGVNYWAHSPNDSSAGLSAYNWVSGSLPANNGTQIGLTAQVVATGTVTVGSSISPLVALDAEAMATATSADHPLPSLRGVYGYAGIIRSTAAQSVTDAISISAGACSNESSAGATITNCYGVDSLKPTAATSRNYSYHSFGDWLTENNTWFDAVDSGGTPRHLFSATPGNIVAFRPLVDANGFEFQNIGGASLFKVTTSAVTVGVGAFNPTSAAGSFLGGQTLPWAGLYYGNAANQTMTFGGTFTGNRTATFLDVSGTVGIIPTQAAGKALCEKADHAIGHCSTAVDASGNCTCS